MFARRGWLAPQLVLSLLVGCSHGTEAPSAPTGATAATGPSPVAASQPKDPWAVSPKTDSVAELACPTVVAPFFFRIEKNGKTSFLLGTRHIGVAWRKMPAVVHDAFDHAKLLVLETVDSSDTETAPAPHRAARDELGPALWSRYRALAGDAIANAMEDQAAMMALMMLQLTYEDKLSSLDGEIEATATQRGLPIEGLETDAFQQRLLDKYLDGRAARAFVQNLDSLDELRQDTIEDLSRYCAGIEDKPGIKPKEREDLLRSGYTASELDTFDKEMLSDRNHAWIPLLEKILARGDVFIAVGADHTIGPQGVTALLGARGYTVTRVPGESPPIKARDLSAAPR